MSVGLALLVSAGGAVAAGGCGSGGGGAVAGGASAGGSAAGGGAAGVGGLFGIFCSMDNVCCSVTGVSGSRFTC